MDIPLWLQIVFQVILQLVLIALNAVFACAEIAVIETKGSKLDKLADEGNKRAKALRKLTDNPARFLATIQVAITLAGFLGSAFAADSFGDYIMDALHKNFPQLFPQWEALLDTVSVVAITIILSYITLVCGELVPKRLAMKNSEKVALSLTPTIQFVAFFFRPLVALLTVSTNGVLRMLGINPHEEESDVSEEEIRMLADAGSEQGVIDEEENEMIQNVFNFDDITVGEVATHRTEMTVLWEEDDAAAWDATIKSQIHSYYPICSEDIDHITGVLNAEIYLRLEDKGRESVMKNAVTRPYFVAQVMKTNSLFREMKKERVGIAFVVDEYGGTYGIVTITDLVEQIVGTLDEVETENNIIPSGEGFCVAGHTEREDFDDHLDIETEGES
ncbi:MAG: HlyC/CorC family transporter, partial [Clostridia bacterium]|nr:HlyC/CorC family transporter [Clostridia bacterium]